MSEYQHAGCCAKCNEPCFEIRQVWGPEERYPGEPKRLGFPVPGAVRVSFVLMDGSRADMTFCGDCNGDLTDEDRVEIWRRVLRGWKREMDTSDPGKAYPDWYATHFNNGILSEMGRVSLTEQSNG